MPNNRLIPVIAFGLLFPLAASAQIPGAAAAKPASNAAPVQGAAPISGLPGAVKEEPASAAEEILDKAIARIKKIGTFSADIRQTVDMLNQKFEIKGSYLKAPNYRVYLKLVVSGLGDTSASSLQVCDGTTMWEFRQVLDTQSYSKKTIPIILKKLNDPILIGSPYQEMILTRIGFGGPEAMLTGLRKSVKFDQKDEQTVDGKKVWVIRGQWKDRAGLAGAGQPVPSATAPLPSYIPSNIAITLNQDDGWPVKVEMVGNALSMLAQDGRKFGPDGRPQGSKSTAPKVDPSRIVLVYTNLKINPELKPESFAFQAPAGATDVRDETEELLAGLDQVIQSETMRKKAEAGASGVLPGVGIQVPKADAGPPAPGNSAGGLPLPAPQPGPDSPGSPKK